MSDTYEVLTILQIAGKEPKVLRRVYLDVEYEVNNRESFVYTRTRKIRKQAKSTGNIRSIGRTRGTGD